MSPDLRYHIASLAAVFLALGVGILVGTAFVGAPVVERQTRLIGRLEENVGQMRRAEGERQQAEEALRVLLPGIVRGRLTGRRVLMVQTGERGEVAAEAADALRLAGAEVVRVALPAPAWHGDDDTPDEAALAESGTRLAPFLLAGDEAALAPFRDRGRLTGDSVKGPFRLILLVGGGQASPADTTGDTLARTRDTALIKAWVGAGATVVAGEPLDTASPLLRTYQGAGASATVDCLDRAVGKIALPLALAGERGNFGMRPTAERVLPVGLEATPAPSPTPEATP